MSQEEFDIQKFIEGDKSVFNEILNKYKPFVYTVCMSILRNKEDSEEVLQDVFVKIYFSLKDFKGKSTLKTWIYIITYNSCLNKLKKNKKSLEIDSELIEDITVDTSDSYDDEIEHKEETIRLLKKSLLELKPIESTVLTLFYLEELSIRQMGEITSLSESNIKVILHRSRKKLKDKLKTKSVLNEI